MRRMTIFEIIPDVEPGAQRMIRMPVGNADRIEWKRGDGS